MGRAYRCMWEPSVTNKHTIRNDFASLITTKENQRKQAAARQYLMSHYHGADLLLLLDILGLDTGLEPSPETPNT